MTANSIADSFQSVRHFTVRLAQPLSAEDCMVQSMDDASPTRWHLAHTTWFFETFVLAQESDYQPFDPQFKFLFNSYYNTVGDQYPRQRRGMISRPGLEQIQNYRRHVDQQMIQRLQKPDFAAKHQRLIEVGIQHEQQHQELILTDIKHALSCNPTWPQYHALPLDRTADSAADGDSTRSKTPINIDEGVYEIGHDTNGFAFDNESPRHKVFLNQCAVDSVLVTCGEYLQFMNDGGYQQPQHWLSMGWSAVNQNGWQAPMYWIDVDDVPMFFTLAGLRPVDLDAPVAHVSFYEADAFARWAGKRLPTEFEWEIAAAQTTIDDDAPFVDWLLDRQLAIHPTRSPHGFCGSVWQWTASNYLGYPGYKPPAGAVGEYNGKFMCDQHVLRGGSVATHSSHIRPTYRNFFPASTRWQFAGIRLAE
ncbi:Iron(II)-dependent oxidoreductase EgtB [Rubripirellula lacrimiformis]|uniref:Iron(II)-dependent oxidoreductase EgtB n=1 Tax=Rubripirellula lacrimiformis TaxID=1930273 RepID=A0A517NIB1_9BACT|nr:ergothioneine biosynthesis protein EgtB [Rubripirellula lacrimiformis]QDT06876.1 Iron(II)-dependent oxidoreductase EgtB [Rubripirellula lacrimiformis]